MSGASSQQKQIGNQQMNFFTQLTNTYGTELGEDQQMLQQTMDGLESIVAAGPEQNGFSATEDAALNTAAMEQTAGAAAQESTALNESLAAKGGGNTYLPSGATAELNAQLAENEENQVSSERNQIALADASQGRQNFFQAENELEAAPSAFENPLTGAADAATGGGNAAENTENQIDQSNNAWEGILGGIAGGFAGGFGGGLGGAVGKKLTA